MKWIKKDGKWNGLLSLQLPQKSGSFVCRYSCIGYAIKGTAGDSPGLWFYMSKGRELLTQQGVYLHQKHTKSFGVPLSGTVIIKLKGDEDSTQRKVFFWHMGDAKYPSAIKKPFIECWEL